MQNLNWLFEARGTVYDAILMLSGGKDSVLALHDIVTSTEARLLTVTYDDGTLTLSPIARGNVSNITRRYGLDNMVLRRDMASILQAFLSSDLVRTVDLGTFVEVFQCEFWQHVSELAEAFGRIPVVTGNLGYFSSELLLPEQWAEAVAFAQDLGVRVPSGETAFVSYWAEEPYLVDEATLERLGWKSDPGLSTETEQQALRRGLNRRYPKETLDDVIERRWHELTAPRFRRAP